MPALHPTLKSRGLCFLICKRLLGECHSSNSPLLQGGRCIRESAHSFSNPTSFRSKLVTKKAGRAALLFTARVYLPQVLASKNVSAGKHILSSPGQVAGSPKLGKSLKFCWKLQKIQQNRLHSFFRK